MKYSIILLAHKNILQVKKVVQSLITENCYIYIHFNRFFSVSNSDMIELENIMHGHIYIMPLKERIGIQYDGMGLTYAILKTTEAAFENRLNANQLSSYFIFLTAQDYPIKSNDFIEKYLIKNYPKPLFDIHPWSRDNWAYHKFKTFYYHKPRTFIRSRLNSRTYTNFGRLIRAPFEVPTILFEKIVTKIKGSPYSILKKRGYNLFGGAPWWLFPDYIVKYIIQNLRSSDIFRVLKNTKTPDETILHTFLMNSPFKHEFIVYDSGDPKRYTHTFEIFSDDRRPSVTGHPHNLDYKDFDNLISQPHLFARKFDINFDSRIYDLLDIHLKNKI